MKGTFSEEALLQFANLASQTQSADFSEGETYDFTRCVRPNGSIYGTAGKCRKGTEQAKDADEKAAIKQLGGMLPKGEKMMDSKGGLHTAAGKVKERVSKKAAEVKAKDEGKGELGSFDKLTQDQRDRRIKQQTELVRDLKKDGDADWKSERDRLDRMLDKDKEVAANKREANKRQLEADKYKPTQSDKESALKAVRDEAAKRAAAGDDAGVDAAIKAYNNIKKGDTKEAKSPADLATPQKQGKADVDRMKKYLQDESDKLKNLNDAQKQNPGRSNDPDVASRKAVLERNVAAVKNQLKELEGKP